MNQLVAIEDRRPHEGMTFLLNLPALAHSLIDSQFDTHFDYPFDSHFDSHLDFDFDFVSHSN